MKAILILKCDELKLLRQNSRNSYYCLSYSKGVQLSFDSWKRSRNSLVFLEWLVNRCKFSVLFLFDQVTVFTAPDECCVGFCQLMFAGLKKLKYNRCMNFSRTLQIKDLYRTFSQCNKRWIWFCWPNIAVHDHGVIITLRHQPLIGCQFFSKGSSHFH